MVTGSGIVCGLPLKKCARVPSRCKGAKIDKNGNTQTLKLKNALMEAFEERESASNSLDKSRSNNNVYWSRFTDENGKMLTSGAAIADEIFAWSDEYTSVYTQRRKGKDGQFHDYESKRKLKNSSIVEGALIVKLAPEAWQKIGLRRDEFIEKVVDWVAQNYELDAYAIHYDEDNIHLHFFVRAIEKDTGKYIGGDIASKKAHSQRYKSFYDYMQANNFDVVDCRNWRPENVEAAIDEGLKEFGDISSLSEDVQAEIIEQVTRAAKADEAARAQTLREEKDAQRNAYDVYIPKGCSHNEFVYLKNKQAANKEAAEIRKAASEEKTKAKDEAREIVDKANLEAEDILFAAQSKAFDIEQKQKEMIEKIELREYEAQRREEKAKELIKENEQTRADWNAAIDKFNKDRDTLKAVQQQQNENAMLIEYGKKYLAILEQQRRAKVQTEIEQPQMESEEEPRLKVMI